MGLFSARRRTASMANLEEAFNVCDPTGLGHITWNDFKDAARSTGIPFTDAQFEVVRDKAGAKIDLATFKTLYAEVSAGASAGDADADLKAAFEAMDAEGEGKISKKMLRHYLTTVGEKLSDEEADVLLKNVGDSVDLAGFKKAILGN